MANDWRFTDFIGFGFFFFKSRVFLDKKGLERNGKLNGIL